MKDKVKEILNKIIDGKLQDKIGEDTHILFGHINEKYYIILYRFSKHFVAVEDSYSIVISEVKTKRFFKESRHALVKFLRGNYSQNSFNDEWMDELISYEDSEELLVKLERHKIEIIDPSKKLRALEEENKRNERDNGFLRNALGEK